jgi:predicted CXXCH cytochrome family protein
LLKKKTTDLCGDCHGDLFKRIAAGKAHPPVAMGMCFSCHAPHGSENPGMTKKVGAAICTSCHSIEKLGLEAKHKGFSLASANCVDCHDPHVDSKGRATMLKAQAHVPFSQGKCAECHGTKLTGATTQPVPDLCLRCHEPSRSWLTQASVHAPLKSGKSCLSCHGPHTANSAALLDHSDQELCYTCHNRQAALQQGCLTCHNPHASNQKRLLNEDVNTLCRNCHGDMRKHFHKVEGIIDPRTNQPITCISCHLPHSSDEDHLLAYEPSRELCVQCHDPSMIGPAPKK